MTEQDQPNSLSIKFRSATELRSQINSGAVSSATGNPQLLKLVEECADLVSRLSLFSPNETAEDIASPELQYLLVDYFLAEAVFRQASSSGAARKAIVLASRDYWERFLRRLDAYDMLSKTDSQLWERYLQTRDTFEVAGPAGVDAARRRHVKISRLQQERELQRQLQLLRDDTDLTSCEDEVVRRIHTAKIQLCVHETWQHLESIGLELQILALAPPDDDSRHRPGFDHVDDRQRSSLSTLDDNYSDRLESPRPPLTSKTGPILDKSGKPLRPFTLLDKRLQLQDGVFRPDHNLPTMTIDEYLAEERRRGGIIDGGGPQSAQPPVIDEDDYDKADEETMKQRAWDDFKEQNPRGSGNTLNRG